ncbi:MAG: hypothetical protein IJU33_08420 [Bacteroidales bacterium]|jgi:hypothetical protein|nr:hypothetical protein [Bacteroidales bacterium]MBR4218764.1 hypothetical protein [Bacteroidales bacterium]
MKAVFISFYQAFYNDMLDILDKLEIRGFTYWPEVQGRGSVDGEPHYGTHAWPTLNAAILTFVADDKVKPLMEAVHQLDETAPQQGLRAFILQAEEL